MQKTIVIMLISATLASPLTFAKNTSCTQQEKCKSPHTQTSTIATSPPAEPLGTSGIFYVRYSQFSGFYTLLEDGRFSGVHFVYGELAGHPYGKLSESNSSQHLEPIVWANFIDDANQVGKLEADPRFGRSFGSEGLDVTISGGFGTFSTSQFQQKSYSPDDKRSLYHNPIPLSTLAGQYTGKIRTAGIEKQMENIELQLNDKGELSVQAVNCTLTGQLTQYGTTGVYDINVQASGPACMLAKNLVGMVTPLSMEDNKPELAITFDNGKQSVAMVVNKK
jgi:hypothetical protein